MSRADGQGARRSRARRAAAVATLVGSLVLAGCATTRSVQSRVGGWIDRTRASAAAEGEARASYAAVDRLRVHSEPDAASAVTGVLTIHEKVRRYQSEGGFAYVEAEGGLWGWVPESRLVERLPKRASRPEAAEPPPAEGEPVPAPEESAAGETAGQAEEEAPTPDAEPAQPERSVFDPY